MTEMVSLEHVRKMQSDLLQIAYNTLHDLVNDSDTSEKTIRVTLPPLRHYLAMFEATAKSIDESPRKEEFWIKNLPNRQGAVYAQAQRYMDMLQAAYGKTS